MGEEDVFVIWTPELNDLGKLEQSRYGDYRRCGRGPGMHHQRCGTLMKRGVRQINVGQHHDQQHDKHQAAEDDERRRFDVPLRHRSTVLTEFAVEVNPSVVPYALLSGRT